MFQTLIVMIMMITPIMIMLIVIIIILLMKIIMAQQLKEELAVSGGIANPHTSITTNLFWKIAKYQRRYLYRQLQTPIPSYRK
jgi:hypothetical protein